MYHTSLERSIRGLQIWNKNINPWTHVASRFPKKRRLGPQNGSGSSGPEKLLKIVSRAETYKLKELMVGVQMDSVGGHQYPPRSLSPQNGSGCVGPEDLLKIVSCDEAEKLKELMLRVQME